MSCLIKGCNFLLKNISDEAFMYHRNGNPEYEFQTAHTNIFPYLLVNIGSGVSIMKVRDTDCIPRNITHILLNFNCVLGRIRRKIRTYWRYCDRWRYILGFGMLADQSKGNVSRNMISTKQKKFKQRISIRDSTNYCN